MPLRIGDFGPVVLRTGIVLCLALAALLLAVDSAEYRQLTPAGIRALLRGALPLLGIAGLHMIALDAPRWLQGERLRAVAAVAFTCDVVLAIGAARMLRRNGTPVFAIALVVAVLLGVGSWSALRRQPSGSR